MRRTIGYHLVKSGYGLWLPGDQRGHWSEAWDNRIGYTRPHQLNPGDPARKRMAAERMKHPPLQFTAAMIEATANELGRLIAQSRGGLRVSAAAIESTHMHLLLPYTGRDIDRTAAWVSHQTTRAVGRVMNRNRPVWAKGCWRVFVYDEAQWAATSRYIRRHHERAGRAAAPYDWITPL